MSNGNNAAESLLQGIEREVEKHRDERHSSDGPSRHRMVGRDKDRERERERNRERDHNVGGDYRRRRDDENYDRRREYGRRSGAGSLSSSRRDPYDHYGGGSRGGYYDDYYGGGSRSSAGYRDDYRGGRGGGGGGGWRDAGPREPSPVIKRSPTPEGTIPISQHVRKKSFWDVAPPGYEGVTPTQAKNTGMFGIPGQSRTLGMPLTSMSGAGGAAGAAAPGSAGGDGHQLPPIHLAAGLRPGGLLAAPGASQTNRQARRLYVGNLGNECDEKTICAFFNARMAEMGFATDVGDPAMNAQVNMDKGYAFVEFRSVNEATRAMSFDGIVFRGQSLKIRRPKDYVGPDMQPSHLQVHVPGVISTNVPDSMNKIFVGGLPTYLDEEQIVELLKAFGELRSFNLVRDATTGTSKGFAFCEYVDPTLTDVACQGLNDMDVGDRKLVVQRASVGQGGSGPLPPGQHHHHGGRSGAGTSGPDSVLLVNTSSGAGEPTRAMTLLNMVTPQELLNDEEYTDIVEDVREECQKFGRVVDVRIPRPHARSKGSAAASWKQQRADAAAVAEGGSAVADEREGVGRVYVRYEAVEECKKAIEAIAGRQFAGRVVIAAFVSEENFPVEEDGGRDAGETSAQQQA